MRIFDLAFKDLFQILRDRKSALFLIVMPLVFTAFMGFAFGQGVSGQSDARLPLAVIDHDPDGALSQALQEALAASPTVRVVKLSASEAAQAEAQVQQGKLNAVLIIPENFSARVVAGESAPLTLITEINTPAGQTVQQVVQTEALHLLSAVEIGRISVAASPAAPEAARPAALQAAITQALQAWREPPFAVTLEKVTAQSKPAASIMGDNPYTQASPGMILQFVVFGLNTTALVLVLERKSKTLARMLTTSMRRAEIIVGHTLAMFLVVFLQEAVLVLVGQFGFGVNYLREPAGTLLVMAALALCIAGLGLFIGVVAKAEEQVVFLALLAMFLFSALGGAWFPLEVTGQTFSLLGHLTPGAWAMDGFKNIVVREMGLSAVLLPSGILLAYAAAFLGLAIWRFKFE